MNPSFANELALSLKSEFDLAPADLNSEHLQSTYSNLTRLDSAPDFSNTKRILSSVEKPDLDVPVLGVMVETRAHPALSKVVDNIIANCDIPVQLFHGVDNLEYIRSSSISEHIKQGRVGLSQLNAKALNASEYNALLLDSEFWQLLGARNKILIFQSDSLCCENSDFSLRDFMHFDYIGSAWQQLRPIGIRIKGGSGGFSLRDWQNSLECLERFEPMLWPGGEDGYFAFHLDLLGAKVANMDEAARFSTQGNFTYRSFGAHALRCLNPDQLADFLDYCPQAVEIFPSVFEATKE